MVLALVGPQEVGLVLVDDVAALVAADAGVIVIATDVSICVVVGALGDLWVFRAVAERPVLEKPSFICSEGVGVWDGRFIARPDSTQDTLIREHASWAGSRALRARQCRTGTSS